LWIADCKCREHI